MRQAWREWAERKLREAKQQGDMTVPEMMLTLLDLVDTLAPELGERRDLQTRGPWRLGQHYAIHVYEGDRPVATFHQPADAVTAVEAVNARA